jgi:cytochrome c
MKRINLPKLLSVMFHQMDYKMKKVLVLCLLSYSVIGHTEAVRTGEDVFVQECSDCHSIKQGKNKFGPSLYNLIDRQSGTISDYQYSYSMSKSNIKWTKENLDLWITNPKQLIPGVKMPYQGLNNPTERTNLIEYLSQVK